MRRLFPNELLSKLIFILALVLLFSTGSLQAATSPDAIAFRVMPNSDHLSPRRWYQENIKVKGSPQALVVDGYEAVRDGRTVYVNAANIDLSNGHCSNDQSRACSTNNPCASGITCVPTFYSNIYIISYNQQAENATVDIFGQILSHWKFNANITDQSQKEKIIRDTKRLADLADLESALANYQAGPSGDYPSLAAGSYIAGKSISTWPSWRATLSKDLAITLPLDPVNKLGDCSSPPGYNPTTCWNQTTKKFADPIADSKLDLPADSRAYVYSYNGNKSYSLCAIMESGYLTTLSQGACVGSTVGHGTTCTDTVWTPRYTAADICAGESITETSNCGRTKVVVGTKPHPYDNCAANTCVGKTCDTGCKTLNGTKTDGVCCVPNNPSCTASNTCAGSTCNNGCTTIIGTKTDGVCCVPNNPSCTASNTCAGSTCNNGCATITGTKTDGVCCVPTSPNCAANTCAGRTCDTGCATISGTKTSGVCACTLPWGVVIGSGQSITAYQASSVAYGLNCVSEARSCVGGTLSGSYQFPSCTVNAPRPCIIPWGGTIAHGQSITAHQASSVAYGLNCVSQFRLCADGTLSGSYSFQSCVAPGCNDGNLDAGNGEECDPPGTTGNCTTVASTPCGNITVQGTRTCRSDCKWNACQGLPPTIEENTSTLCNTSNKPLTDYACCVLTKCSQDGCACCGRGSAPLVTDFTSVETKDVSWEPWGSRSPAPGWDLALCDTDPGVISIPGSSPLQYYNCQTAVACGQYKTASDALGNCTTLMPGSTTRMSSNNCPTASCRLSRDLRSQTPGSTIPATTLRNWYVTTNDSTAYYKCWK